MSNDLLVKIAVMGIVEKYCEDTETIEDVIRRYEEFSLKNG